MNKKTMLRMMVFFSVVAVLGALTIVGHDYYIYREARSVSLVIKEAKITDWYFAVARGVRPDGDDHYATILVAKDPKLVEKGIEIVREMHEKSACKGNCATFSATDISILRLLASSHSKTDFLAKNKDMVFVFRNGKPSSVTRLSEFNPIRIATTEHFVADRIEFGINRLYLIFGSRIYIGQDVESGGNIEKLKELKLPDGLFASEFKMNRDAEFAPHQITDPARLAESDKIQAQSWTGLFTKLLVKK